MEREILFTGIGGQGVQLAAQVLARAAVLEERHVLLLGTYGGSMRGGNTDATLVIGESPISTPPIVSRAWSLLAMHGRFCEPLRVKLRPGGLAVLNAPLCEAALDRAAFRVFDVDAGALAQRAGSPQSGALALLGAFASLSGIVGLAALEQGLREALPPYRKQHLAASTGALALGFESQTALAAPAWAAGAAA
jgi:Pyruvate/2-oxoacid:ferredoxin oxidoreductase gamma subunit